ncbi:putative uncharacterized protein DDB_G0282133 [Condylostylus longicornis]|uniref:putative uncharacterized protein DDB_G0282133 n=1 Tax=Condylostylus longicornis TaxID=2530218 RepID=UPI00244E55FC|nr:putative uncharacterized protein DDB_G0282133 [Condylostylus longicornis]
MRTIINNNKFNIISLLLLNRNYSIIPLLILGLFINIKETFSLCYFPIEIQGSYITQGSTFISNNNNNNNNNSTIQYNQINITEDSIPILGICYRRIIDNNIILMMSSDETTCYRCFNIKLISKNLLRILTTNKDFIFKCYANEGKALQSCPQDDDDNLIIANNNNNSNNNNERIYDKKNFKQYNEIILYKKLSYDGEKIRGEYCPFNGPYKISYFNNNNKENIIKCTKESKSKLDNCPSGSSLNLRLRGCSSFNSHDVVLECLGHWENKEHEKFLALKNSNYNQNSNEKILFNGLEYICVKYDENLNNNGIITIKFSKDSICLMKQFNNNGINNQIERLQKYLQNDDLKNINKENEDKDEELNEISLSMEILQLYPIDFTDKNSLKRMNSCKFPKLLHGNWEHINIMNDSLIYRDQISYKSYTMKCVEKSIDNSFLVYSRTQCDEEIYQCIKIKIRDQNIIEFQIGITQSQIDDLKICNEENFNMDHWITQSREDDNYKFSACPINGIYHGIIPDAPNLCAKLISNCKSKDVMFYEVYSCDFHEIYEERKYRCLGQWKDDKFVYTYTKRLDVLTYECFIGAQINHDIIFIKEAGEHCSRLIDPLKHGMELNKIGYCSNNTELNSDHNKYDNKYPGIIINVTLNDNFPSILTTNTDDKEQQNYYVDQEKYNQEKNQEQQNQRNIKLLKTYNNNEVFIPPPSHIISAILKENTKLREQMNLFNNNNNNNNDYNNNSNTVMASTMTLLKSLDYFDNSDVNNNYNNRKSELK